jgi:two-component system chemotaxis response regulator CheY
VNLPQLSFRPDRFRGLRFLIVQDNHSIARLVSDILQAAGARDSFVAQNGKSAIELLALRQPDIIIADWKMSVMDGLEMCRVIRQAAVTPNPMVPNPRIPIVMLTDRNSTEDILTERNSGINEFVVKPFSPASLLSRIEMLLSRPRNFVTNAAYIGPDRRRRVELDYTGALRRMEDPKPVKHAAQREDIRETIYAEVENLRSVLTSRREMNREAIKMTLVVLEQNIYRTRQLRDRSIQRAAEELLDYLTSIGPSSTESQRIDAYLESVTAFCSLLKMSAASETPDQRHRA